MAVGWGSYMQEYTFSYVYRLIIHLLLQTPLAVAVSLQYPSCILPRLSLQGRISGTKRDGKPSVEYYMFQVWVWSPWAPMAWSNF
jgi:hypothetical protein